ncbi:cation diffusion facilitator family transporter [Amphibacillus cookii]|uniref:cation diffusion facilitator family transporter n=1 Tax=Amphibacillus cookii TaxID=767787 RepID=UPI00195ED443|nr:cation diffusion facilitator family transporter [Amphibacillus cookii]MBM7540081.1 cation diffusion facilitator family transporter [Amphibacillus cookii]
MNPYDQLKKGERGAWVSIFSYLLLAIAKLIVSYFANSQALRADGLNNTTDVIASIAVLIGLRISRKPPDEDHHYGHFKAELIASLMASFIMVTVGLQVILISFQIIWSGTYTQPTALASWTALISTMIMIAVYVFNLRLSKKINSSSLYATAQGNKSDALISLSALIGILGAQVGWYWLDPIAGIFVGGVIVYTAWKIFKDTSHTLTDGFDDDTVAVIRTFIEEDPEIIKVRDIKGRHHGNQTFLDIIIYVNPSITVAQGHEITDRIEIALADQYSIPHAHIHVEPNLETIDD